MTVGSLLRLIALLCFALVLVAPAPVAMARSKAAPDKVAQKVEKKLAHYKKGALLHLTFKNNKESTGTLRELGESSFTLMNLDTNTLETHNYVDVDTIGKGSEEIGKGSGHHHHGIL